MLLVFSLVFLCVVLFVCFSFLVLVLTVFVYVFYLIYFNI